MNRTSRCTSLGTALVWALLAVLVSSAGAGAQDSTAALRGVVKDANGPIPRATVLATEAQSGFRTSVTAGDDGAFVLSGLKPGTYDVTVSSEAYKAEVKRLTVLVGQDVTVVFVLSPSEVLAEGVMVVGDAGAELVDTRSSEAATNVTPFQIESLPQDDRNFLSFAALAPGIRMSKDPQRKTIAGDAQPAEQTNIYIDGVSQKNDVLQGGAVGQDSSRGNSFPQNAVQEFRVITQNYSAQYDKASSAIITAITRSGGNDFKGEAFWYYQPKAWVGDLPQGFQYSTLTSNVDYKRSQPGLSLGGPIIQDKLHFFLSYEGVDEHATTPVNIGNSNFQSQFGQYAGVFASPFKSNLGFGKLSWQPAENQLVDWSGSYRREHETRDFGTQTSFESATNLLNWVYGSTLRHTWNNEKAVNQATLAYQDYGWNPQPTNPNLVGRNYEGVIRIGGNSTTQEFDQKRIELRDDYNFPIYGWHGDHSLQFGGNLDSLRYRVNKSQNGNPQYNYRNDPANGITFAQPFEAQFGFGNPVLSINNQEYGIYGQDTWAVNSHLTVNLGLRWDYESNGLDTKYQTPANIQAGLAGKVDSSYFSNGHNRSQFTGAIQPRIGFSYDVQGNGKSVVFGGVGRYYDRLFLNATLDERFRLQYPVYRIEFSPDGRPGTIKWNDSYLSPDGLRGLVASGATNPEIYLLNKDTKQPYSNQWNLGFRQAFGTWQSSLSYNGVRGYHGFTWLSATGLCCSALVPGFGNVIISDRDGKRYWYDGVYFTLDRPYRDNWSVRLAWTHGKAEQTGNDLFSLDYPSAAAYPKHEVPDSERDRIVATGIFGLPWEIRFATSITLGSGAATNVLDFSQGFDLAAREKTHPFERSIRPQQTWGFADRSVDFRLQKDFPIGHDFSVGLVGEVFNAFNWATYGCLNNFIPPEGNPSLGQAGCVTNLPRRYQVGAKVSF